MKIPPSKVVDDGQWHREYWPNGGEFSMYSGQTVFVKGMSPTGRLWSKSCRTGIHNNSWKPETVIKRGGKEWIWTFEGDGGPTWVPYHD